MASLLAQYKFEDNTGTNKANLGTDSSGSHTLTLVNHGSMSRIDGIIHQYAVDLSSNGSFYIGKYDSSSNPNGIDLARYVVDSTGATPSVTQVGFSVCFWIYVPTAENENPIKDIYMVTQGKNQSDNTLLHLMGSRRFNQIWILE